MQPVGPSLPVFGFQCRTCGEWHTDLSSYEVPAPVNLLAIPEGERAERCIVETDFCMIDEAEFYVRALLEVPIIGFDRTFVWMVWVSLAKADFLQSVEMFEEPKRSHVGPFPGLLDSPLPLHANSRGLKAAVHLQDDFMRPLIELDPADHALSVEQRTGMTIERVAEIVAELEAGLRVRR